jgi:putative two-component system response regulator
MNGGIGWREERNRMKTSMPRLLLVEDERDYRTVLARLLRQAGFDVAEAGDGKSAMQRLEQEKYDLVLLDAVMPGMDGIETARAIKNVPELCLLPVVMLTGHDRTEFLEMAVEAGADEFLPKSADMEEIVQRVRVLVEMRKYMSLRSQFRSQLASEVADKTCLLQGMLTEKETLNREILHRIALAAEYRDDITGRHTERVGVISSLIARSLGREDEFCQELRHTAPLHDVGKIGIPDAILLKPGKLDAEEWRIMQTHTLIGGRILGGSRLPLLADAETIAITHHERWDGRGYPRGLAGSVIPLVGRIVSVADTFDAMTTERPYKRPMPVENAVRIIEEEKGRQFDPDAVEAFTKSLSDILESIKTMCGRPV